jgi:hypothetical protein
MVNSTNGVGLALIAYDKTKSKVSTSTDPKFGSGGLYFDPTVLGGAWISGPLPIGSRPRRIRVDSVVEYLELAFCGLDNGEFPDPTDAYFYVYSLAISSNDGHNITCVSPIDAPGATTSGAGAWPADKTEFYSWDTPQNNWLGPRNIGTFVNDTSGGGKLGWVWDGANWDEIVK